VKITKPAPHDLSHHSHRLLSVDKGAVARHHVDGLGGVAVLLGGIDEALGLVYKILLSAALVDGDDDFVVGRSANQGGGAERRPVPSEI